MTPSRPGSAPRHPLPTPPAGSLPAVISPRVADQAPTTERPVPSSGDDRRHRLQLAYEREPSLPGRLDVLYEHLGDIGTVVGDLQDEMHSAVRQVTIDHGDIRGDVEHVHQVIRANEEAAKARSKHLADGLLSLTDEQRKTRSEILGRVDKIEGEAKSLRTYIEERDVDMLLQASRRAESDSQHDLEAEARAARLEVKLREAQATQEALEREAMAERIAREAADEKAREDAAASALRIAGLEEDRSLMKAQLTKILTPKNAGFAGVGVGISLLLAEVLPVLLRWLATRPH